MNNGQPAPIRTILGIETSCDDTAAAVVVGGALRSNVVSSQRVHEGFGGVVPELASRAHQRLIVPAVQAALDEAGVALDAVDAVAVTYGPGLAGSLLVGLSFAKALALGRGLPLVGVNHLEGHIYSPFLEPPGPDLPFLSLVVSGGHTQLARIDEGFQHTLLGKTRDDAAGEAFDKVGKLLGLGYPAGPAVDRLAQAGDPAFLDLPRSRPDALGFSFSGLKTSVLYHLNAFSDEERVAYLDRHLSDVCAAFQQAIVDVLVAAVRDAVRDTGITRVSIAGGVSANSGLRLAAESAAAEDGFELFIPSPRFSTDNAAMIAITGHFKLEAGHRSPLTLKATPSLAL